MATSFEAIIKVIKYCSLAIGLSDRRFINDTSYKCLGQEHGKGTFGIWNTCIGDNGTRISSTPAVNSGSIVTIKGNGH